MIARWKSLFKNHCRRFNNSARRTKNMSMRLKDSRKTNSPRPLTRNDDFLSILSY
jgi:hypothetical protein